MMSMYWILVIFSLLGSYSHACDQNQAINLNDATTQNLLASMNYFAVQVIQKLLYNPQVSANVILSPMSIYSSLTLVLFGAAGDTQKELIQTLGFPNDDFQLLQNSLQSILKSNDVKRTKTLNLQEIISVQSHIAEEIFIQKDYSVLNQYTAFLQCLGIVPKLVDFVNDITGATNLILQWITDNNPKSDTMTVFSGPAPGTTVFVTSLFYLTANWKINNLFSESNTVAAPFYGLNNLQGQVQMMRGLSDELFYFTDNVSFEALEIPYAGDDFTAIFMRPLSGVDPVKFVAKFSIDLFYAFLNGAQQLAVDCQIPKFSSTYLMGLKEPLEAMGITQLFTAADLSNMLDTNQKFVAEVTHNAKIVVDETGTSAVALTTIGLVGSGAPPKNPISFILNSPFLMLIRNTATNTISFATFYYNPM